MVGSLGWFPLVGLWIWSMVGLSSLVVVSVTKPEKLDSLDVIV
ncbi:hypothetical protein UF75_1062 [Desulfosporosinus sp. I2]|nr:hypothetical protein [Desulfosporosinus sp. I2]KJR48534.1 hypothetical protein UF75_1062 [Desulfosporosinus sp. I2]